MTVMEIATERAGTRDEMWEGVLVMPPLANNEHQRIISKLTSAFSSVIDWDVGEQALPCANVSDRDAGWTYNYRDPDCVVYLSGNPARDCGTHWHGGPDLLVEVISPGENPLAKLGFYAMIQTREMLIVDRYPWALELYRLVDEELVLQGRSDDATPTILTSTTLPFTFQLRPATPRPLIVVTHTQTSQTWMI